MIQFKENARTDEGRTEGWKDGQTLFYRTLSATAGGPVRKTGNKNPLKLLDELLDYSIRPLPIWLKNQLLWQGY